MSGRKNAALIHRPDPLGISLASPEPIPEEGIEAATRLMRRGSLFRYAEEDGDEPSQVALWESEFASFVGRNYAVAVNSCGGALFLALHCLGVRPGDKVLVNAWTLAPVPGAVAHASAEAILVETANDLTVDLEDLEAKAREHPGSVLLLSHMRGHVADMDAVTQICQRHRLVLLEDCAHALGATWNQRATGTFGLVACFSTQTYKHLNSGEGGVLVTNDDEIAARAILASGSYMLYEQHTSRPAPQRFESLLPEEPNFSMRLTGIAAAVLRPQLRALPDRIVAWNERYRLLSDGLATIASVRQPVRPPEEQFVGSSLQFFIEGLDDVAVTAFCRTADELGLHIKWFGGPRPVGFTSAYGAWGYAKPRQLPKTDRVLSHLCDIRIPLALPLDRCDDVVEIVRYSLAHTMKSSSHVKGHSS